MNSTFDLKAAIYDYATDWADAVLDRYKNPAEQASHQRRARVLRTKFDHICKAIDTLAKPLPVNDLHHAFLLDKLLTLTNPDRINNLFWWKGATYRGYKAAMDRVYSEIQDHVYPTNQTETKKHPATTDRNPNPNYGYIRPGQTERAQGTDPHIRGTPPSGGSSGHQPNHPLPDSTSVQTHQEAVDAMKTDVRAATQKAHEKWEYSVTSATDPTSLQQQESMDRYGSKGWELVAVGVQHTTHFLYFKRRLP